MTHLPLSAAFSTAPLSEPVLRGEVVPQGVSWTLSRLHPSEMFWRQLRYQEFDVSEMSLASLMIAYSKGIRDFVALPVFTTRRVFHTGIVVRRDAGIRVPKDLLGRRVGVPEYQQTAAVWSRAALEHEFGVSPKDLLWYMERTPEKSHGGATEFMPPPGVSLTYMPANKSIGGMLASAELDAAIVYIADRNLVDRTRQPAASVPEVEPLFRDPVAEGLRYIEHTNLLPVNHCIVIKQDVLRKYPWLALNVYSAFMTAKEQVYGEMVAALAPYEMTGSIRTELIVNLRQADPSPYGVACQRHVFEALSDFLLEQNLIQSPVSPDDVFAPSTLDV